jgi:hypothetical protein
MKTKTKMTFIVKQEKKEVKKDAKNSWNVTANKRNFNE